MNKSLNGQFLWGAFLSLAAWYWRTTQFGVLRSHRRASLKACGPPVTYLWRFNSTNIPGATNATYTIFNAQANNAGLYDVVLSDASGSATSAPARLTLKNKFAMGQNADGTLTLSWPPDEVWILQESISLFGPWSNSASQSSPVNLRPSGANRFYRLLKP